MTRAVFLDRDGTLIVEKNYLHKVEDVELIPGTGQALAKLKLKGFLLILITNQSGVGRGYFTMDDVQRVHRHIVGMLQQDDAILDGIFICPHQPEDNCECRKPKTKLIQDAAARFQVDLRQSFMIGDRELDIEMGQRVGCRSVLVRTGYGEKVIAGHLARPDHIAANVSDAADWILKQ